MTSQQGVLIPGNDTVPSPGNAMPPSAMAEATPMAQCRRVWPRVARVFGMDIQSITLPEFLARLDEHMQGGGFAFAVTPNVDHVCLFQEDAEFRAAYHDADFVLPDGMPLIWGSRLLGSPLVEKLSGSDLVYSIAAFAAENGYSLFLLGAAPGVADAAAEKLVVHYPGLAIAGTYSPPFGFEKDAEQNAETMRRVRESGADMVYVAFGAPKQDLWNWRYGKETGVRFAIGVGASFDFIAGRVKRAPKFMQDFGFEWLWRLAQEPRRLWRRYLVRDSQFVFWVLGATIARLWRRNDASKADTLD